MARRGWKWIALGAALWTAAGCGGSDDTPDGAAAPSPAEAECRTVSHDLGSACVPATPQRVVALDPSTASPTLLHLGAPVVGAITAFEGSGFPDYLDGEQVADVEIVGSAYGVNLEAVAALEPDLIVGWSTVIEPVQQDLEAIAPTVVTSFAVYDPAWRDQALLAADLVGERDAIQAELDTIDDREQEMAAQLAAQLAEGDGGRELTPASTATATCSSPTDGPAPWLADELTAVGLTLPAALEGDCTPGDQRTLTVQVSGETLELVDADAILVYKSNLSGPENLDPLPDFESNPIWPTLRAVREGRAVAVGDAWGQGADVVALHAVLDDIEAIFG